MTPSMLLTGRPSDTVPMKNYDQTDNPVVRMRYIEEAVAAWWRQWYQQHFQSLVPRQKWHQERRNVQVGDVVLIYYAKKTSPGSYRLGIVRKIFTSKDDLVRTAVCEYSLIRELTRQQRTAYTGITRKTITVPVQRLVIILPLEE